MKTAIIESPWAGDIERNKQLLNAAIKWCLRNNYSPYASHRMLTEALDDNNPVERQLGIKAGYYWMQLADVVIFFTDLGWSPGMLTAKKVAELLHKQTLEVSLNAPI